MSFSPVRLNHAVLFVADLDRSLRFYPPTCSAWSRAGDDRRSATAVPTPHRPPVMAGPPNPGRRADRQVVVHERGAGHRASRNDW